MSECGELDVGRGVLLARVAAWLLGERGVKAAASSDKGVGGGGVSER